MKPIKITLLVDNNATGNLTSEHGFSVWIEASDRNILFDTGKSGALFKNASMLNVPLNKTDLLVLSHGHYDHTGGLPTVLDESPTTHIYCHPDVKSYRYSIHNGMTRSIDMPEKTRAVLDSLPPENIHWITAPEEVAPGIGITGAIPRTTMYEGTGGPFFLDIKGAQSDPIHDDLALWITTPKGLVVIVGCSHSGLINTLQYISQLNNNTEIYAVIGGFHLVESSNIRISQTLDALVEIDPHLVVPCHCTGEIAMERLQLAFGDRVSFGHAGAVYEFADEA